jgi:pentatricopeptide repeat protein
MKLSLAELQERLQSYVDRLSSLQSIEHQRQRKRVLQHIGKLNKLIQSFALPADSTASSSPELSSSPSPSIAAATATATDMSIEAKQQKQQRSKKQSKAILKAFHDELQEHAKNKQLKQAMKKFDRLKRQGHALNAHSYGNMINVCVRCNEIDQMDALMQEMRRKHIPMNIVILTTAIKGYAECGMMKRALELWRSLSAAAASQDEASSPSIAVNHRAVSTMLRGCRRIGDVDLAMHVYEQHLQLQDIDSCTLGEDLNDIATSYDYLISLLSQQLDLTRLELVVSAMPVSQLSHCSQISSIYLSIARCYLMLGIMDSAKQYLDRCQQTISSSSSASGGSHSTTLFLQHRRHEYQRMHEEMLAYYDQIVRETTVMKSDEELQAYHQQQRFFLLQIISRIVYLGYDGRGDLVYDDHRIASAASLAIKEQEESLGSRCVLAQVQKFGLNQVKIYHPSSSSSATGARDVDDHPPDRQLNTTNKSISKYRSQLATARLLRLFDASTGHLNIAQLFDDDQHGDDDAKVMLEIGAGSGDWIVQQAAADASNYQSRRKQLKHRWIAMELRCDRVSSIASKAWYHQLSQLAILGGDAHRILSQQMPCAAIDQIFINFPEPPHHHQHRRIEDSQGNHLLRPSFFRGLHRVLKDVGSITIVSDNLAYLDSIATALAEERAVPSSADRSSFTSPRLSNSSYHVVSSHPCYTSADDGHLPPSKKHRGGGVKEDGLSAAASSSTSAEESQKEIIVYRGVAEADVGHIVSSSSYFDRLWENGAKTQRYFLYLRKAASS